MSKTSTIVRMRRNGELVRVKPDGTEEALKTPSLAPRSAAEIEAAAVRGPENPPLTPAGGALCSVLATFFPDVHDRESAVVIHLAEGQQISNADIHVLAASPTR